MVGPTRLAMGGLLLTCCLAACSVPFMSGTHPHRATPVISELSQSTSILVTPLLSSPNLAIGDHSLAAVGQHILYTDGNQVEISQNGGRSWHTKQMDPFTQVTGLALSRTGTGILFGAMGEGPFPVEYEYWITRDGGLYWQAQTYPAISPMALASQTVVFNALGTEAIITPSPGLQMGRSAYLFSHGVIKRLVLPAGFEPYDGLFSGDRLYLAGKDGHGGEVLASLNDGKTFSRLFQSPYTLRGLSTHGATLVAVGGHGDAKALTPLATQVLYRSRDGGHSWHELYRARHQSHALSRIQWLGHGAGYVLTGMTPAGATPNGYAAAYYTHDSGRTWRLVLPGSPYGGGIQSFVARSSGIWAIAQGVLLHSVNDGNTWTAILPAAGAAVQHAYFFGSGNTGVAAVNMGTGAYLAEWASGRWQLGPRLPIPWTAPFLFVSPTMGYRAAGGHLFYTKNGGHSFAPIGLPQATPGAGVEAMDFLSRQVGWIVVPSHSSGFASLYHTSNGGTSWTVVGQVPPTAQLSFLNARRGVYWTATTWASTTDGGRRWTRHKAPSFNTVEVAAMKPSGTITVLTEKPMLNSGGTATLLVYLPSGRVVRDPFPANLSVTQLQFLGADGGQLGFMVANQEIYRTVDGGQVWTPAPVGFSASPRMTP